MIKIIKKKSDVDKWMSTLKGGTAKDLFLGSTYAEKLEKLIRENPLNGIRKINEFYNEALDKSYTDGNGHNYRGYTEAMCGGPFEAVPRAICNAVGSVYPELDRENKNLALKEIFEIIDRQRYDIVQTTYMEGLREPLLFSDIIILRPLYWSGLYEGKDLVKKYKDFQTIKENLIDENGLFFHSNLKEDFKEVIEEGLPVKIHSVNSDFLVAYSFLRSDICDFGKEYAKVANPAFLDRTMHGIIAMRFGWTEDEKEIEKGRLKLKELLPKTLHPRIEPIRKEAGWVNRNKF